MKRKLAFLIVLISFFVLFHGIALAEYWASKNSNKYHKPSCQWAQKIKPSNLVKFETPEAAIKAHYIPCKICKPPTKSKAKNDIKKTLNLAGMTVNELRRSKH